MKDIDFKIGDRVKISDFGEEKTGIIIAKGDKSIYTSWWKVKSDLTGEIKDWPINRLEKIE
ncbi:hypothetical protein ACFLX7_00500 [Chloroflexota bacterium]